MLQFLRIILQMGKDRESFFLIISSFWPTYSAEYKLIVKAYDICKDAFRDMKREDSDRYFEHLRQTVLLAIYCNHVRDHKRIIALLMHDIVEDIRFWTLQRVEDNFDAEIALRVEYFSKEKISGLSKGQLLARYYRRLAEAPFDIIEDKLTDRLHNLLTLEGCDPEKQLRKIEETIIHFLPLAEKTGRWYWEFIIVILHHQIRLNIPKTVLDYILPGLKEEDILLLAA